MASSVTDNGVFPVECRRIAGEEQRFAQFRREPTIIRAMEHLSRETGQAHLDAITSCCGATRIERYLDAAAANDRFGRPETHGYPPYGAYSPKTLEYVHIAHDLTHLFGDLTGFQITEIGGGYGGQALVLRRLFELRYTIVDLPDVQVLQRRYHAENDIDDVTYVSAFAHPLAANLGSCDLVISNYAFTECRAEVQRTYLDAVIARARRGYMVCNFVIKSRGVASLGKYRLLRSVPGSHYEDERPELFKENRLMLWDRSGAAEQPSRTRAVLRELKHDCGLA